jgi:hypothetical protein
MEKLYDLQLKHQGADFVGSVGVNANAEILRGPEIPVGKRSPGMTTAPTSAADDHVEPQLTTKAAST